MSTLDDRQSAILRELLTGRDTQAALHEAARRLARAQAKVGQLSMPRPRARSTDPTTSQQAAAQARGVQRRHAAKILQVIRDAGRALTAEQVSDRSGDFDLDKVKVAKRWNELVAAGLVSVQGEGTNANGRKAQAYGLTAWEASPAGATTDSHHGGSLLPKRPGGAGGAGLYGREGT